MEITTTFYAADREEWRAWLQEHHDTEREVWLIFYKKGSSRGGVTYDEAVEEALCFGWIDGIAKGVDTEKHAQRFTPRKPRSNWSESNKARVTRLIAQGRMTEAGMAAITFPLEVPGRQDAEPLGRQNPQHV